MPSALIANSSGAPGRQRQLAASVHHEVVLPAEQSGHQCRPEVGCATPRPGRRRRADHLADLDRRQIGVAGHPAVLRGSQDNEIANEDLAVARLRDRGLGPSEVVDAGHSTRPLREQPLAVLHVRLIPGRMRAPLIARAKRRLAGKRRVTRGASIIFRRATNQLDLARGASASSARLVTERSTSYRFGAGHDAFEAFDLSGSYGPTPARHPRRMRSTRRSRPSRRSCCWRRDTPRRHTRRAERRRCGILALDLRSCRRRRAIFQRA